MKAVLLSIKPKYCELIASGKKTIEVRKTKPKIETPFKCYIYETNWKDNSYWKHHHKGKLGKVIGEFVCDSIDISVVELKPNEIEPCYWKLINGSCLTKNELINYGKYNALYGWHITDLKIYNKPKELSEFCKPCHDSYDPMYGSYCIYCDKRNKLTRPPQSWCYVEVEE